MTQATTFTRGYDPMTGKELWKYSGNSEIAIPTPIVGPGFVVITNGYRGVQPIFAVKPGARATSRCKNKATKSDFIPWSTTRGGPYIPTPVIYGDQLYVLQNNGVLAAYKVATGERVYQKRLGERRLVQRVTRRGRRQDLLLERRRRRLRGQSRRWPTSCSRRTRSAKS